MHAGYDIIGPGALIFMAVLVAVWGGSLYVTVDALRRPAVDYTGVREGRWPYAAPAGLYALLFAADQVPWVAEHVPALGTAWLVALVPVVALIVAYLLRVVFPTRARLDARAAAKAAGDDAGEDGTPAP